MMPDCLKSSRMLAAFVAALVVITLAVATIPAQAQTYTDLHDFNASAGDPANFYDQGVMPQGHDGEMYATSIDGGQFNEGTVFKISPTGTPTVVFSFDILYGDYPICGMTTGTDGNFYSATANGTTNGAGSIVQFTSAGAIEKLLYAFTNGTDGSGPTCAPTQGNDGNYYGVTTGVFKGTQGTSTFYKITPAGTFTLLHTFAAAEGNHCSGITLGTDGNFYGACQLGGANSLGTLFKVSTAGKVTVLHSLTTSDGQNEQGGFLVQAKDGNFYGVGYTGGTDNYGVIFQLKPSGAYKVLHNFTAGADGALPAADLTVGPDGNLYGTAAAGGSTAACSVGCGVIFKITTAGVFTVPYTFDGTHGSAPESNLTLHTDGLLYGDTATGGANGQGVFFSFNAGFKPFVTIYPTLGKAGTKVSIMGQGFDSTSVVKFGGVPATTVTLTGTTYITATVPAGAVNGYVTVTTGATTLTSTKTFTVHDSWASGAAMPTAVESAAAGFMNGKIYVVGGGNGTTVVSNNQVYNTAKNAWTTAAAMPSPVSAAASAVVNNVLYIFGGYTSTSTVSNEVQAYNPVTNTWSTKTAMPTARGSATAVVDGTSVYVIGGNGSTLRLNTVEKYNITTNAWTEEAPLLVGKSDPSAGLLGGTIVAADGYTTSEDTGDNEVYNIATNKWSSETSDPTPRNASCFGALSGQLYVAGGGSNGTPESTNASFNATANKWTAHVAMLQAVISPGSAVANGQLYCFGGSNVDHGTGTVYNSVQIYQP